MFGKYAVPIEEELSDISTNYARITELRKNKLVILVINW